MSTAMLPDLDAFDDHGDRSSDAHADRLLRQAYDIVSYDALSRNSNLSRRGIMKTVLRKQQEDLSGCTFLPVTILFFVLYALVMSSAKDIGVVFRLEAAIRAQTEGSLEKVESIPDVWDWLRDDMTEVLFVQETMYGAPLPKSEWSRVFTYSQVQGAVILEQYRSSDAPWGVSIPEPLDNITAALQETNEGFIAKDASERRLDVMREELRSMLPGKTPGGSVYQFVLYPDTPIADIKTQLNYLQRRNWLDLDTNSLVVKVLLLNAETGRYDLESIWITLSFSRGGGIFHRVFLQSLFLYPFPLKEYGLRATMALLWVSMLMGSAVFFGFKLYTAIVNGQCLQHVTKGQTIIEFLIIALGWIIVVMFCSIEILYMSDVREKLADVRQAVKTSVQGEVAATSQALEDSFAKVLFPSSQAELISSWYTLFLMFRFFMAFRGIPRLAVVANTIQATCTDLLHFMVVFVPTFLAYMISGHLIFGRRLEEFSTIRSSLGTCFRILIENEYEWERLSQEYYWTSAVWTWMFLVLVVLIMLNMVLAMTLGIYNDVRQRIDSADTVFLFLRNLSLRASCGRDWVPAAEVEEVIKSMHGSTTFTKEDLKEVFPKLTNTQANLIYDACQRNATFNLKQELLRVCYLNIAASIKVSIDKVSQSLSQLTKAMEIKPESVKEKGQSTDESEGAKGAPLGDGEGDDGKPSSRMRPHRRPDRKLESSGGRMVGSVRPFPGMPKVPGGCNPPLLAPEKAVNKRLEQRPAWLIELDGCLDRQDEYLVFIEAEMKELQARLHHANVSLASNRETFGDMSVSEVISAGTNDEASGESTASLSRRASRQSVPVL